MTENKPSHPKEEILERFAIGRLDEPVLGEFEEHLLLCEHCQERLDEVTEYVALMREATQKVAAEIPAEAAWRRWLRVDWMPMPVMAGASVILIAVLAWQPSRVTAPKDWRTVELATQRGGVTGVTAMEGFALHLRLDATGLAAAGAMAQIVNAPGKIVVEMPVVLVDGKAELRYAAGLDAGQYWVRLKKADETLREYSLAVVRR